jgi:hypothetical protein
MNVNHAYKITNDALRVVSEWCYNLERHSIVVNYNGRGVIWSS